MSYSYSEKDNLLESCFCIFFKVHKAMEIYIPMIKQRKLKHKKNFDKRFHKIIHEFAVSRHQKKTKKNKKKKKKKKRKVQVLFGNQY